MADAMRTALNAQLDQIAAQAMTDLCKLAAKFDGLDFNDAAYEMEREIIEAYVPVDILTTSVAMLALTLHRERQAGGLS